MMLVHIGQPEVAAVVHNAWLKTMEDGIHTYDVFSAGVSNQKVGTREFALAVVERLGQMPQQLRAVQYTLIAPPAVAPAAVTLRAKKELVGVDVFLDYCSDGPVTLLAGRMEECASKRLALRNIAKKWTMPVPNWANILNQLAIRFEDRFPI